ncbi:hypothetical protein [Alicyclobacillus pomorum]|uniref:hypothetical protein n=1 Tax=Alicyclobacillus pomorum TaxID=204470 RepID=UPI00047AE289|nr:hypothetical protein [Alicyclobacillus pomorum]
MAKKRKTTRTADEIQDKPDYAADWFRPKPKPEKSKVDDAAKLSVEDRLSGGTVAKLAELKAKMESDAQAHEEGQAGKRAARKHSSPARPADPDDESKSFAELFDPQEEETDNFEDLLNESKLDWRSFKE